MQVPKTCVLPLDDAPYETAHPLRPLGKATRTTRTTRNGCGKQTLSPGAHPSNYDAALDHGLHTHVGQPCGCATSATRCATACDGQSAYTDGPLPDIHTPYVPGWCNACLTSSTTGKAGNTTVSRSFTQAAPKPAISPDSRYCLRMVVSFDASVNSNLNLPKTQAVEIATGGVTKTRKQGCGHANGSSSSANPVCGNLRQQKKRHIRTQTSRVLDQL